MMRLIGVTAGVVALWYLSKGNCDAIFPFDAVIQGILGSILSILCVVTLIMNIWLNQPMDGAISLGGLILTFIYWGAYVLFNPHVFECRGASTVYIGFLTMLFFFTINMAIDMQRLGKR